MPHLHRLAGPLLPVLLVATGAQARLQLTGYTCATDTLHRSVPGLEVVEILPRLEGPAWGQALTQELEARARASMEAFVEANADPGFLDPAMPLFQEGEWRLEWATPELAALRHASLEFSGGAHPVTRSELLLLAWDGSRLAPLSLDQVMAWTPELEKCLRRQCTGQLRLLGSPEAKARNWRGLPSSRLKRALPTEMGLLYVLDPYEAGAYVDGAFEFIVPWRVLGDHVRAGGVLERALSPEWSQELGR